MPAQTVTGSIRGAIVDSTGAILPNATVTATNIATHVSTGTKTNASGEYAIRFLQVGKYKLSVGFAGFATADYGPFTENTISSVPLNGRDFSQLTVFTPRAVSTAYGNYGQQNSTERAINASNEANANGSRQQSNNYLLDGQEINENLTNTIGYSPSPDSLVEMRIIAANANAEFGNVNGGDIIMVMKSGDNSFHGSVFGFLENNKLNANSWANDNNPTPTPKNPYTQLIFGATFGGPIIKDQLFFFVNYAASREHQGGLQTFSVAPATFRTGDLSIIKSALGIQLYDSQTLGPNGQAIAYPKNQVTITNPVAKYLFSYPAAYPLPNNPTSDPAGVFHNFIGPANSSVKNDQGDVKIDYHLHLNDVISGRYSQSVARDATTTDPLPVDLPSASQYPDHLATGTWIHTFSSAIVNSFRSSYARIRFNSGTKTDPSGIFGVNGNSLVDIPSPHQQAAGFSLQSFNGVGSGVQTSPGNGYVDSFGANPQLKSSSITSSSTQITLRCSGGVT